MCFQTGYVGRVGVFEIWRKTETDHKHLLDHADEHLLRRSFYERGGRTVLHNGLEKVAAGISSLAEIQRMGALTITRDSSARQNSRRNQKVSHRMQNRK
jgi:general secretion pathway protein E